MNVEAIFNFFQKFKLFFHENNVFNIFVENFRGKIEPYVVVSPILPLYTPANNGEPTNFLPAPTSNGLGKAFCLHPQALVIPMLYF